MRWTQSSFGLLLNFGGHHEDGDAWGCSGTPKVEQMQLPSTCTVGNRGQTWSCYHQSVSGVSPTLPADHCEQDPEEYELQTLVEFGLSAPCRLPNPSRPDGELQGKTRSTPLVWVSEPVPLKARLGHVTFIRLETRHRALPAVTLHLVGTRTEMPPVAACCWEGARAQRMERRASP